VEGNEKGFPLREVYARAWTKDVDTNSLRTSELEIIRMKHRLKK
jgi:hypothetical protein